MLNVISDIKKPSNEVVQNYSAGSAERQKLRLELQRLSSLDLEIPLIIGGKEIRTGNFGYCIEPHDHSKILARYHKAGEKEVEMAIKAALDSRVEWENMPFQMRISIFLRAAELLSTKYRYLLNASTMLNQSKNVYQAEIDAVAELVDFWRFNSFFAQQILKLQPLHSPKDSFNYMEYRALEGFIYAVTPFNFTSIAGNLPTSPAIMGNTVVWKPASNSVFSNYFIMKILQEAGLPSGVINFIPGSGVRISTPVLNSNKLAGLHFTGSTAVFSQMWKDVGDRITMYDSYPKLVGETGGKDFLVAHPSADIESLSIAVIQGAFEYQGQKCSALSRLYCPDNIWKELKIRMEEILSEIRMGSVQDFNCYINAVIDEKAFKNTVEYINHAHESSDAEVIMGGKADKSKGYFIEPTVIQAHSPYYKSMQEEIFAPVLTVFVYKENDFDEILDICDKTSPYGLTGSIFANDRSAIITAFNKLRHAAGNFYINDKPTGAVVGQQPFGGSRGSGTNDKSGYSMNLTRWVSPRTVKEYFGVKTTYKYPFMEMDQ